MVKKRLIIGILLTQLLCTVAQHAGAQEAEGESGFIVEEELAVELDEKLSAPRFIYSDALNISDVEPAVNYYIRSDITRRFSGLVTNLKLIKVYGIVQERKSATVYFDYSYTSVRNRDNTIFDKGKMTFIKFNSGKWFNAELAIYLKTSYPLLPGKERPENRE